MKSKLIIAIISFFTFTLVGCENDDEPKTGNDLTIVTGKATTVEATKAVVEASISVSTEILVNAKLGFIYGEKQELDVNNCVEKIYVEELKDNKITAVLHNLSPSVTYYYRAFALVGTTYIYGATETFTTLQDPHEYVDLGLKSGTLWATCNVGANTAEQFGDFYAWGEIKPKDSYSWSNYIYCEGTKNSLLKYNFKDGKIELDQADDAAYVQWGRNWRIPSEEQLEELYNNCTWSWTEKNGVKGYDVKSKTNNNSIFIPAAYNSGAKFAAYSTRTADRNDPTYSNSLFFNHELYDIVLVERYEGRTIRPVYSNTVE